MRRPVVAIALLATALAACSSGASPGGTASGRGRTTPTTAAPTTTTTVVLPAPAPIRWTRCRGAFDCASITVPVDYAAPAGPTLEVAVVRRRAGDPAHRIGTLIMNPGGPGSSGVGRVERGFDVSPEVAQRFDIVGFDPRGIGASTPISCGSAVPAFQATDLAPTTPAGQQAMEAAAKAVADQCTASEGVRLPHLGTIDVVHDLEVLRRDLGEPQVSFVGLSYGTMIGLLWAEEYPGSVRAMVLDGVVDPTVSGYSISREQLSAVDDSLAAIDKGGADDTTCPVRAAGGVTKAYDELSHRIDAGTVHEAGVGPTQLAYAFFYATYGTEHWPTFWQALADGLAGDLSGIGAMARSFNSLASYAPFALVTCLDTPHALGAAAWAADARRAASLSPRFGAILSNELLPCAFWPASRFVPHRVVAPGTPPILVMGSTGDVATPYPQAVRVAADLARGVLLTIDIQGHVALDASDCATAAATRYLVDLTVPAPGTRC